MLKSVFYVLIVSCCLGCNMAYSQTMTPEQAKAMAERVRTMSPDQIMKFKDSMMNAVLHHEAAIRPNGDQLLIKHHYDTTYTTVSFVYRKTTQSKANGAVPITEACSGKSAKAPMLYEGNGHVIVQCSMTGQKVNTSLLDKTAKGLNKNQQYMTADEASNAASISSQSAFASMMIKDKSLKGTASYQTNSNRVSVRSVDEVAFSFDYDPVQNLSTVAAGAELTVATAPPVGELNGKTVISTVGVGTGAGTDPSVAKMVGVEHLKKDPKGFYATVVKTPNGFKVTYTRSENTYEHTVNETLTATIGEKEIEYEAVIQPYKCNYETWVPKGPKVDGSDDKKGDDSLMFNVAVYEKGNKNKPYPGSYKVKWLLGNVTHYKGICSNYPKYESPANNTKADLKFSDSLKSKPAFDKENVNDSEASSLDDKGNVATVRVMCLDYGAWGKLVAYITLDNGSSLDAHPYYADKVTYLTVPYDRDENMLADAWEKKNDILHKGYALDWDEDVKPDNGNNGDGIVLIDEYRGFLTEDNSYKPIYQRLSPNDKELFTVAQNKRSSLVEAYKYAIRKGALGFTQVTDVKVYPFSDQDYGQEDNGNPTRFGRWVNYNSPLKHKTHGVAIMIYEDPNPKPNSGGVLASTKGDFPVDPAGYMGGQPLDQTYGVLIWGYDLINNNDYTAHSPTWYLPARPEGNDWFNKKVNAHVKHANAEYNARLDTLNMSQMVDKQRNLTKIIMYTVSHEIGHATNIHHHHFSKGDDGIYEGDPTCIMKYWLNYSLEDNGHCADWVPLFLTGVWDPSLLYTPETTPRKIRLCTTDDDCFHQMKLK